MSLNKGKRSSPVLACSRFSMRLLISSWSWCKSPRIPSGILNSSFNIRSILSISTLYGAKRKTPCTPRKSPPDEIFAFRRRLLNGRPPALDKRHHHHPYDGAQHRYRRGPAHSFEP